MAKSDQNGVHEHNGGTPDWIELHNNTNADIVLSNKFYLSDDKTFLKKWHFEQDVTIPAKGYLILWADKDVHQTGIHTNFNLDADGGDLFMTFENMTNVQEIHYTKQALNKGYARIPNGTGNFIIQNHTFNANNEISLPIFTINSENNNISIYPNPSSGLFNIKDLDLSKKGTLVITNSLGKIVSTSSLSECINLENEPSGIYFISIKYEDKMNTFRLIINRK